MANAKRTKEQGRKEASKLNPETWVGIANLVLLAITGIFVALYLQSSDENLQVKLREQEERFQTALQERDQDFQKQLIDIQNQAQTATIEVNHSTPAGPLGGHIISLVNTGKAAAKNIRIAICINRLNPIWRGEISSISQFEFEKKDTNPSLKLNREDTETSCGFEFSNNANNAVLFTIDSLPPREGMSIAASLSKNIPLYQTEAIVDAFMLIPSEEREMLEGLDGFYVGPGLADIAVEELAVATFQADASCENCSVISDNETVFVTTVSTIYGSNFSACQLGANCGVDTASSSEGHVSFSILGNTPKYIKTSATIRVIYDAPEGIRADKFVLYLQGQNHSLKFIEISQSIFDAIQP